MFSPEQLLRWLSAIVPAWRSRVVPAEDVEAPTAVIGQQGTVRRATWISSAELHLRVFGVDVLCSDRCGGRMVVCAVCAPAR